jgi:hypothetical protein
MIFISHRYVDEQKARQMAELLRLKSVQCYLDVLDPATKGSQDITKHIMGTLDKCSHVIVIYSSNTVGSMWVPFELGAAYKGGKGIGTYLVDQLSTPEYLDAFPKMRNTSDIEQYVEEYRADQRLAKSITNDRSINLSEAAVTSQADSFIRRVKSRLRQ